MTPDRASGGPTIRTLAAQLAAGDVTATELVDDALARIADPAGEGSRAFLAVDADGAREEAARVDRARADGRPVPPFAGIPAAVKDLCDIAGQVTTAGSVVLADRAPAEADAPVVARLRAAGFIPIGRTNMTEFAYSGLGLNAHYDTPRSPWDRAEGRIPGGSSSGTAVAVADGMAAVGIGTDTGGSCRIPAAFCGIVGYKPTASRVPLAGIVPLAPSLDSVGPLGRTVDCCALFDAVLAGDGSGGTPAVGPVLATDAPAGPDPSAVRLGALTDLVTDDLDPIVAAAYQRALDRLAAAGVEVAHTPFPELGELPTINAKGGLATAEAYHWHRDLLAEHGDRYDQRVRRRIEPGANQSAADYLDVVTARRRLIAAADERLGTRTAFVLPTVAVIPPTVASFDAGGSDHYGRLNLLCLRNTSVGNFLDACAISVPIPAEGGAPVGLMVMAPGGADQRLLDAARTVEAIVRL